VRAKQQVVYTAEGLASMTVVDPDIVTAWQRGLLVFRNDPLAHVIAEINRYRPGKIFLLNEEVGRQPVLATFRIDRIEESVPRLQAVFGLKARSLPRGIVLLS
jgi:transmembrane sensor